MPQIIVEGIAVDFPKEPYPCQIDYMQSNIRAIIGKENALLESPTGTGKTLSLLCSTLAWQRMAKANKRTMSLAYNSGPSVSANALKGGKDAPPKISNSPMIIYATRTHSQLSQVVSELRSTAYKPKTSVLGSREQLCIHEKISKFRGGVLNHNCSVTSAQGRCSFKNNLSSYDGADVILDIEELVKLGKSQSICPYFFSRDVTAKADIVLLPYNYLLDSTIRSTMESIIDWQDAVIIFDEAHNVERVASDAASCSLSSTDVANTILELKQTLQLLRDEVDLNPLLKGTMEKTSEVIQKPKLETVASLLKGLFAFERHVANVNVERGSIGQNSSATFGGEWLRKSFETVGFPCSGIQV